MRAGTQLSIARFPQGFSIAHRHVCGVIPLNMSSPKKRRKPMTVSEMARLGGKATAKKLTAEQRKESARKAAKARWAKQKKARELDQK